MSSKEFEEILDECLDMMRAGVSIDGCTARHPQHAEELRAQLSMAQTLHSARPAVQPEPAAQGHGRTRLLAAVARETQQPSMTPVFGGMRWRLLPQAVPAVVAMLILGGAAWGVSAATGNPNPGSWIAGSSSNDDEDELEFEGTIAAIDATSLTITTASGEVTFQGTPDTEFKGDDTPLTPADFALGDFVEVKAFMDENAALVALEVEHEGDEEADEADGGDEDEDVAEPDDGNGDDADEHEDEENDSSGSEDDGDEEHEDGDAEEEDTE